MNLKGRDFLTLLDYTPEEIAYLVDLAGRAESQKEGRRSARCTARQKRCADL